MENKPKRDFWNWSTFFFLAIVALSFILRFHNLESIPRWFNDEGENLDISWNLAHGELRWYAYGYAFIPRPPLFLLILEAMLKAFGYRILALRSLTAFYGVAATVLVYFIGRSIWDAKTGLLAGLLYAANPLALSYSRIGFTHNQFMVLSLLTCYSCLKYLERKENTWLHLSWLSAGLSLVSEYTALASLVSVVLFYRLYDRGKTTKIFLASASFFAFFAAVMFLKSPTYFINDFTPVFRHNNIGLNRSCGLNTALVSLILLFGINYLMNVFKKYEKNTAAFFTPILVGATVFFLNPFSFSNSLLGGIYFNSFGFFFALGLLGLLWMDDGRCKRIMLAFIVPLLLVVEIAGPGLHRLIPLYPYLSIGAAVFLGYCLSLFKTPLKFAVFAVPQVILLAYFSWVVVSSLAYAEPVGEDYRAADFINSHSTREDLVLAPAALTHLINARTSYMVQALAIENKTFDIGIMNGLLDSRSNVDTRRFRFNCSYRNAKYVVTDEGELRLLNERHPDVANEIRGWKIALETRNYIIYENPGFSYSSTAK